ncbi:MAG: hypothetical protein LUF85_10480 [Bacteroides sp.]|nr:hypothetical protein [Bacteroides sp.]
MKYRFILYLLILLCSSCSEDQTGIPTGPDTGTGEELTFHFHLSVPGLTEVETRGMADNEYTIREIDILVFHDDEYLRLASGRDLVKTANGYKFETNLLSTTKEVRLFFIANISATLHENIDRLEELNVPVSSA